MAKSTLRWLVHSVGAAIVALLTACGDATPAGPNGEAASPAKIGVASRNERLVDLGACNDLAAPEGSKLASHAYADGVQIYRWSGTSWTFVAPSAVLSADAGGQGTVGIHYAGPTWESVSGSKVVGTVAKRCTPDPNAIPWLLLSAVSSEGPGIFHRITAIQRINTVGGNAPASPGSFVGEEARVHYTADYLFYRSK